MGSAQEQKRLRPKSRSGRSTMGMNRFVYLGLLASLACTTMVAAPASAQQQKPNILVIMADDVGYWNISAYNRGMMGYRTPNIDLHRLLWPAVLHRRPLRVHHRPESDAHRPAKSWPAGGEGGTVGKGSDDCRAPQAARLRNRTIRQ